MSIAYHETEKSGDVLRKKLRAGLPGSFVAIIGDLESNRSFLEHLAGLLPEIKRVAREEGMTFLRDAGLHRVFAGTTTLQEINKVTFVEVV